MSDANDEGMFGLEGAELDRRFAAAVRRTNEEKLILGVPLPKYDASTKRAYLLYADDIKRATHCTDIEAAVQAEELREGLLARGESFTFETVLSTPRNLDLLRRASERGCFVRCIYVLTASPDINVAPR